MASNYKVLSRKYRPQTISEVVGQVAAKRIITNCFLAGRFPHAMVLNGMRGVGKTTFARIIAQVLNCQGEQGLIKSGIPTTAATNCRSCDSCLSISRSENPDVFEMDAASYTGVQDIREIIESARYRPIAAKYKVFIIDEAHMLSNSAFNALLKTVEEPPPHVKFILATTEIKKIPLTILSRCQKINLSRISRDDSLAFYSEVITKEGFSAEKGVIDLIARFSDGSLRDGLSLLDQVIAVVQQEAVDSGAGMIIRMSTVSDILGIFDEELVIEVITNTLCGRFTAGLELLQRAYYENNLDPEAFLEVASAIVKKLAFYQQDQGLLAAAELTPGFCRLAAMTNLHELLQIWRLLTDCARDMASQQAKINHLEVFLLQLAALGGRQKGEIAALAGSGSVDDQGGAGEERADPAVQHAVMAVDQPGAGAEAKVVDGVAGGDCSIQAVVELLRRLEVGQDLIIYNVIYNELLFDKRFQFDFSQRVISVRRNNSSLRLEEIARRLTAALGEPWSVVAAVEHGGSEPPQSLSYYLAMNEENKKQSLLHQPLIRDIIAEWSLKVDKVQV